VNKKMDKKQKQKILIVDDDVAIVRVLKGEFEEEGFEVLTAYNGQIGIDKALSDFPDLILLDIVMPVIDGLEVLRILRKDKRGADIPVVVLTNYDEMEKMAKAKEMGAIDFLVKTDWRMQDIMEKVKMVLRKK